MKQMARNKSTAITEAARSAGLIASKFAELETAASQAMQEANGTTVQIVSCNGKTTTHIKSPGLRVVLQDGAIAIEASGIQE
jgi:hypothetical protein